MLTPPIRVCTLGVAPLSATATATEAGGCIGRAGDVSRLCARFNLVYEVLILRELAQLEVTSHYFAVTSFKSVAKFLDCVCVDECTSCFTFSMDSVSDFTSVFVVFITNSVNVAICLAAALLCSEAIFCNTALGCIEAIFQARVDSVEAITETFGDATELAVNILIVEAFEKIGTSERALYSSIVGATISKQSTITKDC